MLSQATARLVQDNLPGGVELLNLGSHQLKDIAKPEGLFQLLVAGLQAEFAPLKTLGAASRLPVPATTLVGRDGELRELTALLSLPDVRLVTLTGPGGSGKTRLAIGLATSIVALFPDGVYFVSLESALTAEVMWTTIADVLAVPAAGRMPSALFDHVAHLSALFVLDNLEQLEGASGVVAELLTAAPRVRIVATSRKPLHVTGEHEHPVPALELPGDNGVERASRSGAVQLFVQHARMVRPSFELTPDNTPPVVAICRRLDGLPLAIELAAARSKLLTPKAMLDRLDTALDLRATEAERPTRQQTLRHAIDWSYHLLTLDQQTFFRRLAAFSGGADLDATAVVLTDMLASTELIDLIADLVDASLLTITDGADGEPRIAMLQTIRSYALDVLTQADELETIRRAHAYHYADVAGNITSHLQAGRVQQSNEAFATDIDNFREALGWALVGVQPPDRRKLQIGQRLWSQLGSAWMRAGHLVEARRWADRMLSWDSTGDAREIDDCYVLLTGITFRQGDLRGQQGYAAAFMARAERSSDKSTRARAFLCRAEANLVGGDLEAARIALATSLPLAREAREPRTEARVFRAFADINFRLGHYEQALEMEEQCLACFIAIGDAWETLVGHQNVACTLRMLGEQQRAYERMSGVVDDVLQWDDPGLTTAFAEDYAAVLAELGRAPEAVWLLGAAEALRQRTGHPRHADHEQELAGALGKARQALTGAEWEAHYQRGSDMSVDAAIQRINGPRDDRSVTLDEGVPGVRAFIDSAQG